MRFPKFWRTAAGMTWNAALQNVIPILIIFGSPVASDNQTPRNNKSNQYLVPPTAESSKSKNCTVCSGIISQQWIVELCYTNSSKCLRVRRYGQPFSSAECHIQLIQTRRRKIWEVVMTKQRGGGWSNWLPLSRKSLEFDCTALDPIDLFT